MEKQEEEEVKRRRVCSSSSLPLDLTLEILLRLPAKSVVRSRCVSKLWSSLTTLALPCFINSFAARSWQSPCLLIFTVQGNNLVVFSLPQQGNSDKSSSSSSCPVDSYLIKEDTKTCLFSLANSVQGLYCFQKSGRLVIWNPTMRWFSTLTKAESSWGDATGFIGYDPIDGTYKTLCMPFVPDTKPRTKNSNHPRVLTLGSAQESWRSIKGSFEHYSYTHGQCINGVLYYESFLKYDSAHSFIVSFHVRSEKFNKIQVPWKLCRGYLLTCEGELASLVYTTNMDAFISLWVLEDAESHEWSFRIFSLPFPLDDPISHTLLILTGVTEAGEFVYAPTTLENPFHALYFDPQRNSFRRVIYEGIADNEFRRRNGLGNKPLRRLHIFPNHVGSLMSF